MSSFRYKPTVGVLANQIFDGRLPAQSVDEKYLQALELSGVNAMIIPAFEGINNLEDIVDKVDGLLFTGAVSNVHPARFDPHVEQDRHAPFDEGRDATALTLSRLAIQRDIPLLAICRGLQELNVACGGTLKAGIIDDPQFHSHSAWNPNDLPEVVYGRSHVIRAVAGGRLHGLTGGKALTVNSVHVQAIDRLGQGLMVEATADDGTIEAISLPKAAFILGVQWHPEYDGARNNLSRWIFAAFGAAVCAYRERKEITDRVA